MKQPTWGGCADYTESRRGFEMLSKSPMSLQNELDMLALIACRTFSRRPHSSKDPPTSSSLQEEPSLIDMVLLIKLTLVTYWNHQRLENAREALGKYHSAKHHSKPDALVILHDPEFRNPKVRNLPQKEEESNNKKDPPEACRPRRTCLAGGHPRNPWWGISPLFTKILLPEKNKKPVLQQLASEQERKEFGIHPWQNPKWVAVAIATSKPWSEKPGNSFGRPTHLYSDLDVIGLPTNHYSLFVQAKVEAVGSQKESKGTQGSQKGDLPFRSITY